MSIHNEPAREWIKVSEKPPKLGIPLIIYPCYGDVGFGYYDETYYKKTKRFKTTQGLVVYDKVTHYMMLPKRPEKECLDANI